MAGILSVQQIQGLATAADPTTVEISSGHTLYAPGHVIQIVQGSTSTHTNTSSSTYVDTGLSATITPKSASSLIYVFMNFVGGNTSASAENHLQILRGSTSIRVMDRWGFNAGGHTALHGATIVKDSPNTTSATTYKVQYRTQSGYFRINDFYNNANHSTLTLMEVAQ